MTIAGYIDASTFIRLSKMADKECCSISKIIGEAIDSFFDKMGSPYPATRRAAVSAQGRASQEAGSAQGREDRGKTHTEARHG